MPSDSERRDDRTPEETLAILGQETRLAILRALWDAEDPMRDLERQPLSFAELRKRVGMRDGSQFNYHLKQLVGPFVDQTEDGYALSRVGRRIIRTILSGEFSDEVVFDAEPVDEPCPLCGGQVVFECGTERAPTHFLVRCTACEGVQQRPGAPAGVLSATPLLWPAGVNERSLDEMYRAQHTWAKYWVMAIIEGVCMECSGTVTTTPRICEDHTIHGGRVCPDCDRRFAAWFDHRCTVCKMQWNLPIGRHVIMHPSVAAFYHDHDYETWGHDWLRLEAETITGQTVVSEDPLEIAVAVVVDDDRLDVTLNEEGAVVDVQG